MNRKVKSIVTAAVAMGYGKLSDYHGNSISEVLAEFAAIANSAAKLPAAAAADAGKVPVVQAAGGYALESGTLVVTFTGEFDTNPQCDKTYSEIEQALLEGRPVIVRHNNGAGSTPDEGIYTYCGNISRYGDKIYASAKVNTGIDEQTGDFQYDGVIVCTIDVNNTVHIFTADH
jgi:hypothetical protein